MEKDNVQFIAGIPVREISTEPGVIELHGMRYSTELFQHFAVGLRSDGWFRITKRENHVVHIEWREDIED